MRPPPKAPALFRWLDRLYWLVWIAFPVMVWQTASAALTWKSAESDLTAEELPCLDVFPQVSQFSAAGKLYFWGSFAVEHAVYLILLLLAHRMIHRFAIGRIFVGETITLLVRLGWIVAAWPFVNLGLGNLLALGLWQSGDLRIWQPAFVPDPPTLAVGLLILTLAAAMRHAVALQEDADLTV